MKTLEIYARVGCSQSTLAKTLSLSKSEMFTSIIEYDIADPYQKDRLELLVDNSDSTPQIFIDKKHIGGYNEFADWIDNHTSSMG